MPFPTCRLIPLSAALAGLSICQAQAQVPLIFKAAVDESRVVDGRRNSPSDSHTGAGPVQSAVGTSKAAALAAVLSANADAQRPSNLDGSANVSMGTDSVAEWRWTGANLDPAEAGVLGRLRLSASGTATINAAIGVTGTAATNVSLVAGQQALLNVFATVQSCELACTADKALEVASSVFDIRAGGEAFLTARTRASVQATGRIDNRLGAASSSASVAVQYAFELVEDRRHWKPAVAASLADGASWIEAAAPDAAAWAVFNSVTNRLLALKLETGREWRGLIVDGERLQLDLGGQNLVLGRQGASEKSFNLLIGEGRRSVAGSLVLRDGGVVALRDVVVGGVAVNGGAVASLTLEAGAVLNQTTGTETASTIVGQKGAGRLVVRDGARLLTNTLALGPLAGAATGDLLLSGTGSRIEAQLLSVGERADATVLVNEGAVLQAQSLNLARFATSTASLVIDGTGSQLVLAGGISSIGSQGGRGTLELTGGARLQGDSTLVAIGSGKVGDFSVLRASGPGTQLADVGVRVSTGGLLHLRDGARWLDGVNGLEVNGGTAQLEGMRAKLQLLSVQGQFAGESLVSSGRVEVSRGTVIELGRGEMEVGLGGTLAISGAGTQVLGFDNLLLLGDLAVNGGALLSGGVIGLDNRGRIHGDGGTIRATVITQKGKVAPGNSPGTLTIDGDMTLGGDAELELELAASRHDVLHVTGALRLDGGHIVLSFLGGFAPHAGQHFDLLQVGGSFSSTAGVQVVGLQPGWQFDTGFDAGTGRFTLTALTDGVSAVPEPATWCLWLVAGALAGWRPRRR